MSYRTLNGSTPSAYIGQKTATRAKVKKYSVIGSTPPHTFSKKQKGRSGALTHLMRMDESELDIGLMNACGSETEPPWGMCSFYKEGKYDEDHYEISLICEDHDFIQFDS